PDEPFDFIICPYSDDTNMDLLEAEMESRWGPTRMLYGHAFTCVDDVLADLSTYGNARNSAHSTGFGVDDSPSQPCEIVAAHVGAIATGLSNNPTLPVNLKPVQGILAP